MADPIVIVGAGQAGIQLAESLRHEGHAGPIVLLGDESHPPYNRPPLSKKWLLDRFDEKSLAIRGIDAIRRREIDLRTGTRVASIDLARRRLELADGTPLAWDRLALCTGAQLRPLPVAGAEFDGVLGLKTIEDALRVAAALDECRASGQPLVVVGGGFIGLEVAATARKRGVEVTVLEGLERLMSRVVAPIVSAAALRLHESHGVRFEFGVRIAELAGRDGRVAAVRLADGREFPARCVVTGIGVEPDDALARAAGVECERGILVDGCSRTSAPGVVAAGDCTARRLADGTRIRLESVQNAVEQAKAAAAALMGREQPFIVAPWFWSDQYDMKLQMVGSSAGYDEVVTRGDLAKPAFSAYYFRAGRLIAVDSLSRPGEHLQARKFLDRAILPTAAQVRDPEFDLARLLTAPGG